MTLPADPYAELVSLITRFTPEDGHIQTAINGLFVARKTSPSVPLHTAQWPCLAMVVQGAKVVRIGEETLRYGVGDYLLVALDMPVASCVVEATPDKPQIGFGMAIDPVRLGDLMRRIGVPRPATAADAVRGLAVNTAGPDLLDAVLRLMRLLERPHDIPALAPLIQDEILYRLLTGPDAARLLHITAGEGGGGRVARAVNWLRDHYDQPLRIEALADAVGMSESSLHHQFKAVTAMTPLQYQKQLRLHEARRLMLVEDADVSTAGFRVGYQSPSQFSREYRRLYGLPPARDVEEARRPLAAE
ncbi:AraC family transcriptional regulator [Caulobacter segnis]|uniref:AraC family transcriptional regulator n=1 Tax=Caulobacter segnis TaxID=88688 RepID=UPI00240FCE61|nr:AraC family transcriptional regulator [Caulobacter segnis]MDG2523358.1 AraC family transcriptional regulator [Caulobacter segnis]